MASIPERLADSIAGIIFSISEEIKNPIKFIGVGEVIDDLREFNPDEFIKDIFSE